MRLKRLLPALLIFLFTSITLQAQTSTPPEIIFSPEKGFRVISNDGSMGFRLGFRMQQQFGLAAPFFNEAVHSNFLIRRARVQFKGFSFNGKMDYFIQLGMDRGSVTLLNAEYRWNPDSNTMIAFGQLLPPAGRQFHTISKNFQMIDRSPVTRFFFIGWDLGMRIDRTFPVTDRFAFKTKVSITHGEGKNTRTAPGGWAYTGRFDILPFGQFNKSGDYSESDLYREPTPKLALGTAYYLNTDAYTEYGNTAWDGLDDNIGILYADFVFKYNGFSMLGEYTQRTIDNEQLKAGGSTIYSDVVSGSGISIQAGKFVSKTIEPTLRVSILNPNDNSQAFRNAFIHQEKYTFGLNKFFIGHTLKLQGELGYVREEHTVRGVQDYFEFLVQFQLSF